MIENLNALAAVVMLLPVGILLIQGRLDLQRISTGITSLREVLDFLSRLPRWIQFYNTLVVNKQELRQKSDTLKIKWDDLKNEVIYKERQTGRRRKNEVDNWLSRAEIKCTEVQTLLERTDRETNWLWKYVRQAWFGNLVERKIQEMDKFNKDSVPFEEVLSHVMEPVKLVTTTLVGNAAKQNIERINTLLQNQVTKVGVYGVEGIGKTALMKHIYNQLLTRNDYAHVIMVSLEEDQGVYDLQGEIANQLHINLEEDRRKRAALLYKALNGRKFVVILDGLRKYVSEETIGIPLGIGTGIMIVTSRSRDVCRKTGCHSNIIAMEPLPNNEAFELFKQKFGVELESPLVNIAKEIVEQCNGVPLEIVKKAEDLRGIEDISIWEATLNETSTI